MVNFLNSGVLSPIYSLITYFIMWGCLAPLTLSLGPLADTLK